MSNQKCRKTLLYRAIIRKKPRRLTWAYSYNPTGAFFALSDSSGGDRIQTYNIGNGFTLQLHGIRVDTWETGRFFVFPCEQALGLQGIGIGFALAMLCQFCVGFLAR